jgi:hypothetical protein
LAFLPNVSKVPSLSAIKEFLLEKGQSGKTELPPGHKAKPQREKDKVRMALSDPPNYQQEAKEIPLYRNIDSEKETPKVSQGLRRPLSLHQTPDPVKIRAQMVTAPLLKVNQVRTTLD